MKFNKYLKLNQIKKKDILGYFYITRPSSANFSKIRIPLMKYKKKFFKNTDRIAVIGCTNKPWKLNKKIIKSFIQKHIYFPFPNYGTRKALFEHFM